MAAVLVCSMVYACEMVKMMMMMMMMMSEGKQNQTAADYAWMMLMSTLYFEQ